MEQKTASKEKPNYKKAEDKIANKKPPNAVDASTVYIGNVNLDRANLLPHAWSSNALYPIAGTLENRDSAGAYRQRKQFGFENKNLTAQWARHDGGKRCNAAKLLSQLGFKQMNGFKFLSVSDTTLTHVRTRAYFRAKTSEHLDFRWCGESVVPPKNLWQAIEGAGFELVESVDKMTYHRAVDRMRKQIEKFGKQIVDADFEVGESHAKSLSAIRKDARTAVAKSQKDSKKKGAK
ncbi:MAG: hypothetical protein Q8O94_02960 [bacterium]|nr:hypothetical protein [bacterium]